MAIAAVERTRPTRSAGGASGSREVGTLTATRRRRERGDGGEGEEDAGPVEAFEEPAADDRARRRSRPGRRSPEADRPGPLAALGEDVGEQREGRREDQGRADAHRGAGGDQLAGVLPKAAGEGGGAEDGQSGEEDALSPTRSPRCRPPGRGRRTSGCRHRRSIRAGCEASSWDQRREGDVDDRRVEVDHEGRQQEGAENQPLAGPLPGDRSSVISGAVRRCVADNGSLHETVATAAIIASIGIM